MKKTKSKEELLCYYMNLPYSVRIIPDESGLYFAEIEELPGCMTQGDTKKDALEKIEEAKRGWLTVAIERSIKIPLPEELKEFSGRFLVRVPKYIHERLAIQAKKESISLNQLIVSLLSEKITTSEIMQRIQSIIRLEINAVIFAKWEEKEMDMKDYDLYKMPSFFVKEAMKYYDVSSVKKREFKKQFKQNLYK
jgi:predicted RNase H-like HicB family nuclease